MGRTVYFPTFGWLRNGTNGKFAHIWLIFLNGICGEIYRSSRGILERIECLIGKESWRIHKCPGIQDIQVLSGFLKHQPCISHDGSMGRTVYLPTWMVDFYGKRIGKYTIHGSYGSDNCLDVSTFLFVCFAGRFSRAIFLTFHLKKSREFTRVEILWIDHHNVFPHIELLLKDPVFSVRLLDPLFWATDNMFFGQSQKPPMISRNFRNPKKKNWWKVKTPENNCKPTTN